MYVYIDNTMKNKAFLIPIVVIGTILLLVGFTYNWDLMLLIGTLGGILILSLFLGFIESHRYEYPKTEKEIE